jgi:catechol 2,3-dioxygenase-like lactoylglutathione lyase family enzyme
MGFSISCAKHTTGLPPLSLVVIAAKLGRSVFPSDVIQGASMQLGAFSVSLAVKDLAASQAFYEKLGFAFFAGEPARNWVILKNGETIIGLFQGMIERNSLTFNPGWDSNASPLASFTDVRELQRELKAQGVKLEAEADEAGSGPAYFIVHDPDGNPVLVDQHV